MKTTTFLHIEDEDPPVFDYARTPHNGNAIGLGNDATLFFSDTQLRRFYAHLTQCISNLNLEAKGK